MDTGQVETRHIEDEMKRTRDRIDCKLDELNHAFKGRIATARGRGPLVLVALVSVSVAAAVWMRRRKRQGLPRYSGIPRRARAECGSQRSELVGGEFFG